MINIDYILEDGIFTSHISYIRSEIGAVHSNSLVFLLPLVSNRNQLPLDVLKMILKPSKVSSLYFSVHISTNQG